MKKLQILAAAFTFVLLSGCSSLFENIYNEDGSEKTGDATLTGRGSTNTDITSGLVVIKASEPEINQITFDEDQKTYYVGEVPDGYSDSTFEAIGYTNGNDVQLIAKDDPAEFRCFVHDEHASVKWTAEQTWRYIPTVKNNVTKDSDGNEVSYTSVVSQTAEKLSEPKSLPVYALSGYSDKSRVNADIPYGVTVLTCTITADDEQYTNTYQIVVTKSFVMAVADSSSGNTVTDHGLVVIKATQPGLNAINYDPLTYEYEVGDSTGADTSADLTGRDDPLVFKCYLLDENARLSWSAVQTKKFTPDRDENKGGIIGQTLEELENPLEFDIAGYDEAYSGTSPYLQFVAQDSDTAVMSTLPYGVTEVYATINADNTDIDGNKVTDTTVYKITLTKRYVITSAVSENTDSGESGLAAYVTGKGDKNLISYNPQKTSYSISGLNGGNELGMVRFAPEDPDLTTLKWTAVQTHSYTPKILEYKSGDITYTYQSGGEFKELENPVNLMSDENFKVMGNDDGTRYFCGGELPYGITVVSVRDSSSADANNSITYTVTFEKKQVATGTNIVSEDDGDISLITDSGLVVISAAEPNVNQITFKSDTYEYSLDDITAEDNDMGFRLFLADTDAQLIWSVVQTKEFEAVIEEKTEEITDEKLGTTTTVTTTTVTGQNESVVDNVIDFTVDENFSGNQAIIANIPYGVTVVTASISAVGEATSTYRITLTRNIYKESTSSSSTTSYSKLSGLSVEVTSGDDSSTGSLTPAFDPDTTTYNLTVDEEADFITIDASPASEDAEISTPAAITKYGTVPGISGKTIPLVGGTSRITFTVTDETGISRTYTIYVTKTGDGDTSLSSLTYTPEAGYSNGVDGSAFSFDKTYTGASGAGSAKYALTLSADSRKDVKELVFAAVPNNKRTTLAYGISDSVTSLPDTWTEDYSYDTQSTSPASKSVTLGDESVESITRVLWVRTTSDSYYHTSSSSESGYESEKRADVTYHAVNITKAGDTNQKLTALVVVATYEDGTTKQILTQTTSDTVAWTTTAVSTSVNTYADKLDFYFRPLDKDATVTYKALNTAYAGGEENISFTGYAATATSEGIETLSSCSYLNDGSSEYYHFSLGDIYKANGTNSQTADLPNGTTSVTICGVTYTFVKPNLTDCTYSVSGWEGTGNGIDTSSRTSYIYVDNTTTQVALSLAVTQQNATVRIDSVTQTADANGSTHASQADASYSVYKSNATDSEETNKWKVVIGSADDSTSISTSDYSLKSSGNGDSTIEIPVGTTKVVLYVDNNGTSKGYTYYIVRADDSEARLKTLTLTNPDESSKTVNREPTTFTSSWESVTDGATYVLSNTAYTLDRGTITLNANAVSENATISVTKSRSAYSKLTSVSDASDWETAADVENTSTTAGSFSGSYEITKSDTGTLLFTITVTSGDKSVTYTYNLLAYVEADTTATLTALNIVQKGSSNSYTNTILANSFKSETLDYSGLYANLNYTGDIVVTPAVYEKASISDASATLLADSTDATTSETSLATLTESDAAAGVSFDENAVLTIPASYYQTVLGRTIEISYSVQAQDKSVAPVEYTAEITIPSLTTITERETYQYSSEYSYTLPQTNASSVIAYRFGSVIADESTFLGKTKSYFGGIDIIGKSDNSTWYESSFGQSGFQLVMNVDDSDYWVHLDETGTATAFYTVDYSTNAVTALTDDQVAALGVGLSVIPSFQYEEDTPYLSLTFDVTNSSGKSVKLGASIDTLVGTIDESTNAKNDSVTVENTDNGFIMKGNDYNFTVILKNAYGVDDVDRVWYGAYDSSAFKHMSVFDDKTSSLSKRTDSAASFSWDLGTDSSYSKTIRINMNKAN